jgi:hypothetical protein
MTRITNTLYTVNQWLLPIITLIFIPFVIWVNNSVNQNNETHQLLRAKLESSDMAIVREFENKLAQLPPPDWKARIIALETNSAQRDIQFAELKIMVSDIRVRLFSEPKTANK